MQETSDAVLILRRAVLNAVLTGTDPVWVRCSDQCRARSADESVIPRICPTVSWHLVWLRSAGLVTVDRDGIRPTLKARRTRRPLVAAR